MNIVIVRINGVEYNLKGNEKEEYLHKVASYVDKKVKAILSNNTKLSTSSAAILTALNTVDEVFKSREEIERLLEESNLLKEDNKILQKEVEELTDKLQTLYRENQQVKEEKKRITDENEELLKNSNNDGDLNQKDLEIKSLNIEKDNFYNKYNETKEKNQLLKVECKEHKFEIQSAKYKIIDLQNKLIETQVELAKEKNKNNPLMSNKARKK